MRVRALRGVCIGVDRHLAPGDTTDLEAAQVKFLASIGAVEEIPDEPPAADPVSETPAAAKPKAAAKKES